MTYDKEYGEESWDYLERKCPDINSALYSIDHLYEARKSLFDKISFHWGRGKKARITEKAIDGCLELEIQDLRENLQGIEDKMDEIEEKHRIVKEKEKEWHVFAKEKDKVVFENDAGDLEKIPIDLVEIIAEGKSFDGQIKSEEEFVEFVRDGEMICQVSKSLVNQLREEKPYPGGGGSQ